MSRRHLIRMTEAEVADYLQGRHVMNVASIGLGGQPHLRRGQGRGRPGFGTPGGVFM